MLPARRAKRSRQVSGVDSCSRHHLKGQGIQGTRMVPLDAADASPVSQSGLSCFIGAGARERAAQGRGWGWQEWQEWQEWQSGRRGPGRGSGHYRRPKPQPHPNPNPNPNPNPHPKPGSYPVLGRRGRNEDARRHALPTVEPHGPRARPPVAPQTTQPIDTGNLCEPIPIPIPRSRSRCLPAPFLPFPAPLPVARCANRAARSA
jgi:hypothetical protein